MPNNKKYSSSALREGEAGAVSRIFAACFAATSAAYRSFAWFACTIRLTSALLFTDRLRTAILRTMSPEARMRFAEARSTGRPPSFFEISA